MQIVDVLVYIFGLIAIGWTVKKLGLLDDKLIKLINDYVYYIGISVIVFLSLHDTGPSVLLDYRIYVLNILPIAIVILLAYLIAKALCFDRAIIPIFIIGAFFGNTGYIGFPLNTIVQGKESLYMAAFISTIYTIIALTFGVYLLKRYSGKDGQGYKIYKAPILWATIFGLGLSSFMIPDLIRIPLGFIADTTSPLALLITGAMIGGLNYRKYFKEITAVTALKLILLPAIILGLGLFIDHSDLVTTTSILEAATPVAVTTTVLAVKFNMDKEYASNAVVISTIASSITLAVVLMII